MLEDMPSYGPQVNEMHERTVRRLLDLPAYRLRYGDLGSAVQCLRRITAATH
jgi:hypothetical protein